MCRIKLTTLNFLTIYTLSDNLSSLSNDYSNNNTFTYESDKIILEYYIAFNFFKSAELNVMMLSSRIIMTPVINNAVRYIFSRMSTILPVKIHVCWTRISTCYLY